MGFEVNYRKKNHEKVRYCSGCATAVRRIEDATIGRNPMGWMDG
jgi:hypothetical protein